jgi:hypothetical protein
LLFIKNSVEMNSRYLTAAATLIITISAGTITIFLGQIPQTASAQLSIFTRTLKDDQAGHASGWDPDGSRRSFMITEPEFYSTDDTVVINTQQNNFVVCSVDYRAQFTFEVNCIETTNGYLPSGNMTILGGGPDEGATLYYTVIHGTVLPLRAPLSDILAQAQNATAERRGESPQ